jgi:hypothetical protein
VTLKYRVTFVRTDRTSAELSNDDLADVELSLDDASHKCAHLHLSAVVADDFGICGTIDETGKVLVW